MNGEERIESTTLCIKPVFPLINQGGDTVCPGLQRGVDRIGIVPGERDLLGHHVYLAARGMTFERSGEGILCVTGCRNPRSHSSGDGCIPGDSRVTAVLLLVALLFRFVTPRVRREKKPSSISGMPRCSQ